jgi:tetratricopeptide (TPR) repeat protein
MGKIYKHLVRIGVILGIVGFIISYFLPSDYHLYAGSLVVFLGLIIGAFFFGKRIGSTVTSLKPVIPTFSETLLNFLTAKKADGKYAEIIRWGSALSKPLALHQKYEVRLKVGELIEDAAIRMDNNRAWIKALIEDQGWTYVELLEYSNAEQKLKQGIKLAAEHAETYLLAKGYRYLFSLNFRQNELLAAEVLLNKSLEATTQLPQDKQKDEMVAEYHFAKSSLEHKKGNLDVAIEEIEKARLEYEKLRDKEWLIKIAARKGEILVSKDEIDEARAIFLKGLEDSERLQFYRQAVKNKIGLGICNSALRRDQAALEYFQDAKETAEEIGMHYELDIIEGELKKIRPR